MGFDFNVWNLILRRTGPLIYVSTVSAAGPIWDTRTLPLMLESIYLHWNMMHHLIFNGRRASVEYVHVVSRDRCCKRRTLKSTRVNAQYGHWSYRQGMYWRQQKCTLAVSRRPWSILSVIGNNGCRVPTVWRRRVRTNNSELDSVSWSVFFGKWIDSTI